MNNRSIRVYLGFSCIVGACVLQENLKCFLWAVQAKKDVLVWDISAFYLGSSSLEQPHSLLPISEGHTTQ